MYLRKCLNSVRATSEDMPIIVAQETSDDRIADGEPVDAIQAEPDGRRRSTSWRMSFRSDGGPRPRQSHEQDDKEEAQGAMEQTWLR